MIMIQDPFVFEAVLPAPTPDGYDEIAAVTGRVFVAATPEQFTYDADDGMHDA